MHYCLTISFNWPIKLCGDKYGHGYKGREWVNVSFYISPSEFEYLFFVKTVKDDLLFHSVAGVNHHSSLTGAERGQTGW